MTALTAALITGVIVCLAIAFTFYCGFRWGKNGEWQAGYKAGLNEERSIRNALVIKAKYSARADGIAYGVQFHAPLMSRRAGNVASKPSSIGNRMPPKAEQRCQAVGGNAEGKAPTIAAA